MFIFIGKRSEIQMIEQLNLMCACRKMTKELNLMCACI